MHLRPWFAHGPSIRGGTQLHLKIPAAEARKKLAGLRHGVFNQGVENHWKTNDDGSVRAQSVLWLFCWAKTGMGSKKAREHAERAFDTILPIPFKELDAVLDHEYARKARYSNHNIEDEFNRKLNGKTKKEL
jgi:hypothetical protein